MLPVVTPVEMAAIDAAAPAPVDVLIGRAGAAVARAAVALLGGTYGRRVVVVAGKGNNGNDGWAAAERLRRAGVRVMVLPASETDPDRPLPGADLVVDAAYGTGFRGEYRSPRPAVPATPVVAVDIPSGVSGLTGVAAGEPLAATVTVTFAAWKPGLLLADGAELAGRVVLADIGLDTSSAAAHLLGADDVAGWLPARARDAHKWQTACWVVAGSAGMTGAANLCTGAAFRVGAGYVRLSSPGVDDDPRRPTEAVGWPLAASGWADGVLAGLDRFGALVVGPGLGRAGATTEAVRRLVGQAAVPTVVDGDGLWALGEHAAGVIAGRPAGAPLPVLTPHDGEFALLTGHRPPADRFGAVRRVATDLGAVVLLKGPTTLVAEPGGQVVTVTAGDARLATAGTGDVLSGIIGGLLAQGVDPLRAAAAGAHLHGRAGDLAWPRGLVAGDLVDHLPAAHAELLES